MKVIKKSQMALLSLCFMVMVAGYINYKYNPEREKNLGQTVHVNSSDIFLYENSVAKNDLNIYTEDINIDNINSISTLPSTIATFKVAREDMFSELEETYKAAIANIGENDEKAVVEYQEKLEKLTYQKHLINIVEAMIRSKGIENVVVIPTDEGIKVVVDVQEKLTFSQVALIKEFVQSEFQIDANKITILEN